jgi:hypothetical protein
MRHLSITDQPHYRFQTQSVHDRWDYLWVTIFYKFVIFNVHSLYASYDIHSRNRTGKSHKLNLLRSALARGWTRIYRSVTYDRPQCFTTEQGTLILLNLVYLTYFLLYKFSVTWKIISFKLIIYVLLKFCNLTFPLIVIQEKNSIYLLNLI